VFLKRKAYPAVIINYHRFTHSLDNFIETHPTVTHLIHDFEQELVFLKKFFDVISLDTLVQTLKEGKTFPRPTIAITIDDGYQDNYDLMYPALREHNIPVTIFINTGVIGTNARLWPNYLEDMFIHTPKNSLTLNGVFQGKTFSLESLTHRREAYVQVLRILKNTNIKERDQYLKSIESKLGKVEYTSRVMLNWEEIREMKQHRVSFGAHTAHHPILTSLPLADAKKEILESKNELEKQLGEPIKHFAYPNGRPQDFNEALRAYCRDVGFESVATCDYGYNHKANDVWALKRIGSEVPISLFAFNVLRAFKD
jgi:peptidoglycan/xylan/chitin deacetylase (PgdA/CDA1 family)